MGHGYSFALAIFRFLAFLPFFIFAVNLVASWRLVQKHDVPHGTPWRHNVQMGLGLGGVGGLTAAIYNFILYVPSAAITSATGHFILGVLDLGIVCMLAAAATYQHRYLPPTMAGCKSPELYHSVGGYPSVFNATSEFSGKLAPHGICQSWMTSWILILVVTGIYGLLVIGEFAATCTTDVSCDCCSALFTCIGAILGAFWWLLTWPFVNSAPFAHYVFAWARKFRQRRHAAKHATKYTDPVELQSVSIGDKANNHVCKGSLVSECWACRKIICSSCQLVKYVDSPKSTRHLDQCEPVCSHCYFVALRAKPSMRSAQCRCPYFVKANQNICSDCNGLAAEEITALREERETKEMYHLMTPLLKCVECKDRLPPQGPRWWRCRSCGSECRANCHPSWANDDAKV